MRIPTVRSLFFVGVAFLFSANSAVFAGVLDEIRKLDDPQGSIMKKIMNGDAHVIWTDRSDSYWPEAMIYRVIRSTPEEAAAMFSDYEYQTQYCDDPRLVSAKVNNPSGWTDRTSDIVDFGLDVGRPVGVTNYTLKWHINNYKVQDGLSYQVSWSFIRASLMTDISGDARFESYKGETLFAYHSFISPADKL